MKRLAMIAALVAAPGAGAAQESDFVAMELAGQMATLIRMQEPCGLSYDMEAVRAWLRDNVPDDTAGFPTMLQQQINLQEITSPVPEGAQLQIQCLGVEETARNLGFVAGAD